MMKSEIEEVGPEVTPSRDSQARTCSNAAHDKLIRTEMPDGQTILFTISVRADSPDLCIYPSWSLRFIASHA
jgi:hypothetical protein